MFHSECYVSFDTRIDTSFVPGSEHDDLKAVRIPWVAHVGEGRLILTADLHVVESHIIVKHSEE